MNSFRTVRTTGFSLLEVLIAVVILSFGLLALANLQASLLRNSGDAKARSVALSVAKDRMEDLRAFSSLAEYEALTDGTITFSDASGSLGGVNYSVATQVQRYAYKTDPDSDPTTNDGLFELVADTGALSADYDDDNQFKTLSVGVSWTDQNGETQTITLEDAIGAVAPENSGRLARRKADNAVRMPLVLIKDPSVDAGVIPVAIGDDSETAATNPRPLIDTEIAQTSFDIYTYSALQDGSGNAEAQSLVETRIIGCRCDMANANASAQAYRPTFWGGTKYVAPEEATYAPAAGAATLTGADPTQSSLCDACCRDHHDPAGVTAPKFSPRRDSHLHYDDITATAVTSGEYWEACRMILVDGTFRVAADPYNEYVNVLKTAIASGDTEPFTDPTPDKTAADNYVKFVVDYLLTQGRQSNPNAQLTQEIADGKAAAAGIDIGPMNVDLGSVRWMHARGLYLDWLEEEALEEITASQENCPSPLTLDECLLRVLPFTSINTTEIATWAPLVEASQEIFVANDDFALSTLASTGSQNPMRGRVTARAQGQRDAVATISTSSTGLLADPEFVVNPNDVVAQTKNLADQPDSDGQTFVVSQAACGGNGGPASISKGSSLSAVTGLCDGSDPSVPLASTRVRLRLSLETTIDAASVQLQAPDGAVYSIATTATSFLQGVHTFAASGAPTLAGAWTLTVVSNHSTGSAQNLSYQFSVDFVYAQSFTVEIPVYDFGSDPSFGAGAVTCDPITSSNNPSDCAITLPNTTVDVVLTNYNHAYPLATPELVSCPAIGQSCQTPIRCRNYKLASATRNGAAETVSTPANGGQSNESTTVTFGSGLAQDDQVVLTLSAEAEIAPICRHSGGAKNCSKVSFSCE